jgi:two-component system KDP operon response regulator KdpE
MHQARKRVLLIDDEVLLHRGLDRIADLSGIDVLHAMNGNDGVQMAVAKRPDAIILDMTMPDMDGIRVLGRLKRAPQTVSIPVLIYSARTRHAERIAAFQLGADDYLEKPLELRMLMRRIEHLIFKASGTVRVSRAPEMEEEPSNVKRLM